MNKFVVLLIFLGFFGCCGAYKENYCMVTTVSCENIICKEITCFPQRLACAGVNLFVSNFMKSFFCWLRWNRS